MLDDTRLNLHEQEITSELHQNGFVVIRNFIDNVAELTKECDRALLTLDTGEYKFGKLAKPLTGKKLQDIKVLYPEIYALFNRPIFKTIFKKYQPDSNLDGYCEDIYISHEFLTNNGKHRNADLHFDRNWSLKFLLYLSDVSTSDGPFCVIPGSHKIGRKLRDAQWRKHNNYDSVLNRIELDHPELATTNQVEILGLSGTLIIFDTDIFHKGGDITKGRERKIIRAHCRHWQY